MQAPDYLNYICHKLSSDVQAANGRVPNIAVFNDHLRDYAKVIVKEFTLPGKLLPTSPGNSVFRQTDYIPWPNPMTGRGHPEDFRLKVKPEGAKDAGATITEIVHLDGVYSDGSDDMDEVRRNKK